MNSQRIIFFLSLFLLSFFSLFAIPNFLVIHADDMGWSDLACYGNPVHQTPHIDQLAAEGMLFTQAYAAAPVCQPTRIAAIFGQYPARMQVTGQPSYFGDDQSERALHHPPFKTTASPGIPNLFRELASAGYDTYLLGKWNLTNDAKLYDIKHFPGKDEAIVEEAVRYLGSAPDNPSSCM